MPTTGGRHASASDHQAFEGSVRWILAVPALVALLTSLLLPATAFAAGSISGLSIAPSQVTGGASVQGTVTLAFPDPGADGGPALV